MRPKQFPLLHQPLPEATLFDAPRFRVLVQWSAKDSERIATIATTDEETAAWVSALQKAKAYAVRVEPIAPHSTRMQQ